MKAVSLWRQRFPFGGLLLADITGILSSDWIGATWWLVGAFLLIALQNVTRAVVIDADSLKPVMRPF